MTNAVARTFYFSQHPMLTHKKIKRACKPTHQDSANLTQQTLGQKRRTTANMGLNEMAGAVVNQTVVLSMKFCGKRTVRASKPPLR